jgi:hypothetical protein
MSAVHFPARSARPFFVPLIALAPLAGCAAVQEAGLSDAGLRQELALREPGPAFAQEAEELASLDALALARPTAEECADPRTAGYWRACALAWNPEVRAARLDVQRALAARGTAGRPTAVEAMGESMDLSDFERESKVAVTFDLLGVLGLGPSGVEKEAARIDVRRARARLENAVWTATFDVARARARLAASRVRIAGLQEFQARVEAQAGRFEVLARRGRLSEADEAMAWAAGHEVEQALSMELAREAELRAELSRASGLAFAHEACAVVGEEALREQSSDPGAASEQQLWKRAPALRELALEFAAAEANVRRAAARAWPSLRAGPLLTFMPSELLVGGLLDVAFPWPGTVAAGVRAAAAERDAVHARAVDALQAAIARVESLRTIEREARTRAEEHAELMDEAADANWRAVDAKLRLGLATPAEWSLVMSRRVAALIALADDREAARLASLELEEACGVAAPATEVVP